MYELILNVDFLIKTRGAVKSVLTFYSTLCTYLFSVLGGRKPEFFCKTARKIIAVTKPESLAYFFYGEI